MRLLFWFLLALLVLLAIQKKFRPVNQTASKVGPNVPPASAANSLGAEDMVCCASCQVYFPVSEAVYRNQQVYCCAAHADAH